MTRRCPRRLRVSPQRPARRPKYPPVRERTFRHPHQKNNRRGLRWDLWDFPRWHNRNGIWYFNRFRV